jgi:hypothetical protein
MGLNSQLEANTQTLNRAQQDKAYTESLLAEQVSAWKAAQDSTNPQTLEKQLSDLQSATAELQARYTDDHPDVIKTKADIAEVKKKLAEVNKATRRKRRHRGRKGLGQRAAGDSAVAPAEFTSTAMIAAAGRDQKRWQQEIAVVPGAGDAESERRRGIQAAGPRLRERAEELPGFAGTRKGRFDGENEPATSQGERMVQLNAANLPDAPTFPNRLLFAGGGLGAGLALGCGLAMWLELRDKSIRTEADAEAALELPLLVAVPWVGVVRGKPGNGKFGFWNRNKPESGRTQGNDRLA